MANLGGENAAPEKPLTPQAQEDAIQEGAKMAKEDMENPAGVDVSAVAAQSSAIDPAILRELDVFGVDELVEKYRANAVEQTEKAAHVRVVCPIGDFCLRQYRANRIRAAGWIFAVHRIKIRSFTRGKPKNVA